jgi:predicted O-methyltransferase YrrM
MMPARDSDLREPAVLAALEADASALGFTMSSDRPTGSLLRTLAASKPGGRLLELGTGAGLGTAWLLEGMDPTATLLTVDQDARTSGSAQRHLGHDARVTFHVGDGGALLEALAAEGRRFDLIFADTWPGKFTHLDTALSLLAPGGFYLVDDLFHQPNWPADHAPMVPAFIAALEQRPDLRLTRLYWSTGLILATRIGDPHA